MCKAACDGSTDANAGSDNEYIEVFETSKCTRDTQYVKSTQGGVIKMYASTKAQSIVKVEAKEFVYTE